MIKYITDYQSCCVKFDTETENIGQVDALHTHIDWIYRIPEDGEFTMDGVTKPVKKGDFVIKFYKVEGFTNPFIVFNSEEWINNIDAEEEIFKNKVNMARMAQDNEACGDCEMCENAC